MFSCPAALGTAIVDIRARHPVLGRLIGETVEFAQTSARNT